MSETLIDQLAHADLPIHVTRRLQGAVEQVSAANMSAAFDRLAVSLTAELQDRRPVLLAILPGSSYLLGALMQRMVFPLEVAYGTCVDDVFRPLDETPELAGRCVIVVDDGRVGDSQTALLTTALQQCKVSSLWRCSLVSPGNAESTDGFTRCLRAVVSEERELFGCGMDLDGYCRNLPSLYRAVTAIR